MLFFRKSHTEKMSGNDFKTAAKRKGKRLKTAEDRSSLNGKRAFSGSMTVEAAVVLPWFLFAMLAVMQFFKIETVSSAVLAAMHDTAKTMAGYAYVQEVGITAGDGVAADLLTGGISIAYAKGRVEDLAKFDASDGTLHYWKSSFLHNEMIDLAVTYQAKNTYTPLPIPKVKASLRARVRAWTGRDGDGSAEEDGGEEVKEHVFVAETGHVYHKDASCTHIKLSIKNVSKDSLSSLRNKSGGKYKPCEKCGASAGSRVFVTGYGDRYHSSLTCSGLKRTVKSVSLSEVEGWKACSKCGG